MVSKIDSRRISAELHGDQSVMVDTLIASLQIKNGGKKEVDSQLVGIALESLEKLIQDCSKVTGKRFPDINDVRNHINTTYVIVEPPSEPF